MAPTRVVTTDQPILPPSADVSRAQITRLRELLLRDAGHLMLTDGQDQVPLPAEAVRALGQALDALSTEHAVTVSPTNTLLTPQQAADYLGVSALVLIRLLESGQITQLRPGRAPRVPLAALVEYQHRSATETSTALDDLMGDSAEFYGTDSTGTQE